jgi:hypothetical protein
VSTVPLDRVAEDGRLAFKRRRVSLSEAQQMSRRAFDIREQQGNGSIR